ncbi:MAG: hypothetical protein DSZ08_01100 [Sulfurovum sp.]|nr:MAG: hypothetical protein DSZ08_01100 [Sulfurovum sp.]
MNKLLLLSLIFLSCIYAKPHTNHTRVKVYNIEKNTSTGMRFSIDLLDNNVSVENIQFLKHANIWHLSMNKVNLSKDFNVTQKNASSDLNIIRHQKNHKNVLDYTLSKEEFYAILKLSLAHIKKEFPIAYVSHIRISTPLVNEFWESILPLSIQATQVEKGPFILKENSLYDKALQKAIDKKHAFIQQTCQIFKDVLTLECDKERPIYVTNHSFNQKEITPHTLWKDISMLKEKAFDRKSPHASYIRFNFSNAMPIQEELRLGTKY